MVLLKSLIDPSFFRVEEQLMKGEINNYAEKARENISVLRDGPAKKHAMNFVDYIINRKR